MMVGMAAAAVVVFKSGRRRLGGNESRILFLCPVRTAVFAQDPPVAPMAPVTPPEAPMDPVTPPVAPMAPATPPVAPAAPKAPAAAPVAAPTKPKPCGLLKLSIFCPSTGCGIIGKLLGLCKN